MKRYRTPIFLLSIGIVCITIYTLLGSSMTTDGVRHEPFALLPIGYSFLFTGIVWGILTLYPVRYSVHKAPTKHRAS